MRVLAVTLLAIAGLATQAPAPERGLLLDDLAGSALKEALGGESVVLIPIGRTTEPHPAHLKLNADWRLIDRIRRRLAEIPGVAAAAPVTHVPTAWTSAAPDAADFLVDVCRTLASHGARRFLVIDVFRTGSATAGHVRQAAEADGLLIAFEPVLDANGRHGEPDETLLLLHVDSSAVVDMTSVDPAPARGRALADQALQRMRDAIAKLKASPLPPKRSSAGRPRQLSPTAGRPQSGSEGNARTIINMASMFSVAWRRQEPCDIANLFANEGDIRHPDGLVERGRSIIASNRARIFADRAYQDSKHPLQIASVLFRGPDVAIADGRWELVGVRGQPDRQGPFTWVVVKEDGAWVIAAWRYAVAP